MSCKKEIHLNKHSYLFIQKVQLYGIPITIYIGGRHHCVVYMYVCVGVYVYVGMYQVYLYVYVYIYITAYTFIYIYIYIYVYMYMHASVYAVFISMCCNAYESDAAHAFSLEHLCYCYCYCCCSHFWVVFFIIPRELDNNSNSSSNNTSLLSRA